jgi:Flp pilus assembly protein TadG
MTALRAFGRDTRAASAAEFALVMPLFLLFLLGIIDAGRYAWAFNEAEKATQIGARWAAVTDPVPSGLANNNFVSSTVPQGSVVPKSVFDGVECKTVGANVTCTCPVACGFNPAAVNNMAWTKLVSRMNQIYPGISAANVVINYAWSGLGYAGDPNGPDVAPLISVSLRDLEFQPMTFMLFNGSLPLPSAEYSLTMEDGTGTESN